MISKSYTLDELCIFIRNGKSVKQSKDVDGLPITRIETIANQTIDSDRVGYAGLTEEEGKSHLLECGDILFSHINSLEHLCKTAIYTGFPEKLVHGMNLLCIRPNLQLIFPQYLLHLLRSSRIRTSLLQFANKSVNQASISAGNLKSFVVNIPPLAEQRRIASILDQADELRQKRQQAIEKLDQLLQATFIDMFGDPVDNLKELETVALLDLCKKVTDGTHQSPKWTTKGIPFLFISNIVDGEIDYSSQKFIDQATYDSLTKSTKIELNDILYTTVGSYGNVARVKSDQLFCFQRHIAHIKPDFDKINPKFLEKMLSSYGVRRQADRLVRGVAQKTLNLKDLKEIIVFNIPLVEQNHFVQKCEVIESLKIKSKLALNQIDDLFKSLQNQAFSGNL